MHEEADGREEFFLGDAHAGGYVGEEGGGEVVALGVERVDVACAAD